MGWLDRFCKIKQDVDDFIQVLDGQSLEIIKLKRQEDQERLKKNISSLRHSEKDKISPEHVKTKEEIYAEKLQEENRWKRIQRLADFAASHDEVKDTLEAGRMWKKLLEDEIEKLKAEYAALPDTPENRKKLERSIEDLEDLIQRRIFNSSS